MAGACAAIATGRCMGLHERHASAMRASFQHLMMEPAGDARRACVVRTARLETGPYALMRAAPIKRVTWLKRLPDTSSCRSLQARQSPRRRSGLRSQTDGRRGLRILCGEQLRRRAPGVTRRRPLSVRRSCPLECLPRACPGCRRACRAGRRRSAGRPSRPHRSRAG